MEPPIETMIDRFPVLVYNLGWKFHSHHSRKDSAEEIMLELLEKRENTKTMVLKVTVENMAMKGVHVG